MTTTSGDLTVGSVSYGNNQPLTLTAAAASLLDDGVNSTSLLGVGTGAINLSAANGIGTQTRLALGVRLTVPASAESYRRVASAPETSRMTYRVKRGDTLSQIAERFQVTIRQLMGWNDLRSPSSLRAGQRLILYVDPSRFSGG